jgi:hypothetical protein
MPNVIINELEMYYPTKKIRAATYGRGIWESDLHDSLINPLEVNELQAFGTEIKIIPNPSSGKFSIQTNGIAADGIQVFNIIGKQVYYSARTDFADLSSEPAGIYFLKISTREGVITKKLIIRR